MIIVMRPSASEEDIRLVLDRLTEDGFAAEVVRGAERTVIGVIGTGFPPDYQEHMEAMPHVESATRITKPYKLASRDFRPVDTFGLVGQDLNRSERYIRKRRTFRHPAIDASSH